MTSNRNRVRVYTDETIIGFGKHKGRSLVTIPDDYLWWFYNKNINNFENKLPMHPPSLSLMIYIEDNLDSIRAGG